MTPFPQGIASIFRGSVMLVLGGMGDPLRDRSSLFRLDRGEQVPQQSDRPLGMTQPFVRFRRRSNFLRRVCQFPPQTTNFCPLTGLGGEIFWLVQRRGEEEELGP